MIPPVYPKYFDGVMAEKNYSVNSLDIFECCVNCCGCRKSEYTKVSSKQFCFQKGLCDFKSVGRPRSRSETVIARGLKLSGLVGLGHGI